MKKILCIHGVGGKDETMASWSLEWKKAISSRCGQPCRFAFMKMDDLFQESRYRMNGIQYLQAVRLLISSWLSSVTEKRFRDETFLDAVRLYAGMPAQYFTDELLRALLRHRLEDMLDRFRPSLIFAHSLGSLVAYDALHSTSIQPIVLMTAGSQLGHPALHDLYGGPLQPVPVQMWINLHNPNDRLFASRRLNLKAQNFLEEETPFEYGSLSHEALHYINGAVKAWNYLKNDVVINKARVNGFKIKDEPKAASQKGIGR